MGRTQGYVFMSRTNPKKTTKEARIMKMRTTHQIANARIFKEEMLARGRGRPRRLTQAKRSNYKPNSRRKTVNQEQYAEYLQSSHWKSFKALYKANDKYPQACLKCGDDNVELHHWTYERLGGEFFGDVVPLCRGHHAKAHEIEKSGVPLKEAHLKL